MTRTARITLQAVEDDLAKIRQSLLASDSPVAQARLMLLPRAQDAIRWRIRLDCGCSEEVVTWREGQEPKDRHRHVEHPQAEVPSVEIIKWAALDHIQRVVAQAPGARPVGRQMDFEADGDEPPEWCADDRELWDTIRRREPRSSMFWRATLACGHEREVISDLDWQPGDPPRLVSEERAREMDADLVAAFEAGHHGQAEIDRLRGWVSRRCPSPDTLQECWDCYF